MNFKVLVLLLCLSCASAGRHQKQKWTHWEDAKTEEDCEKPDSDYQKPSEETDYYPEKVGSIPGIPGVDYPNFSEIPRTTFSCADQDYVPGFYADLEAHCQVFHVCYEHRRESFLCPVGTIFNQPILACDYWYSVNCSLSPYYFDVNNPTEDPEEPDVPDSIIEEMVTVLLERDFSKQTPGSIEKHEPETTTYQLTTEPFSTTEEPEDESELNYFAKQDKHKVAGKQKYPSLNLGKQELSPSLKKTDVDAAAVFLKALLPIKAKVSFGAVKPKVAELVPKPDFKKYEGEVKFPTDKPVLTEAKKLLKPIVKQQIKPKFQPPKVLSVPAVVIPKVKYEVPVKPYAALKTHVKPAIAKPVHAYKPAVSAKAQPISLLTKKQMALNYAKLLKLKKLKSPFLGLKAFL